MTYDLMPIGKYKGKQLNKIRESYWTWFVTQEWAENYQVLLDYCKNELKLEFSPVKEVKKLVVTDYGVVFTGPLFDPSQNDGECPFDVEDTVDEEYRELIRSF